MQTLLPARCPIPDICGWSWHWKSESRRACQSRQEEEAKLAARIAANPYEYGSYQFDDHEREVKKKAEATAAHVQEQPTNSNEIILARNGERQLLSLTPDELKVIGLLMASDVYRINWRLRTGESLASAPNAMVDSAGYHSMQEFVDHAQCTFNGLGKSIQLDASIKLFRGIGVPEVPEENYPDIAGIGDHLTSGVPWGEEFTDEGFSFATTSPEFALCYDGNGLTENPNNRPVLLELEVSRGLCAPHPEHRSQDLFEHTFDARFLSTAMGQVVFPPGTRWSVVSIDRESDYGVPLIRMTMI